MKKPRTLLDRVLWKKVLSDDFHESLQAKYDNAVAHHQRAAREKAIKDSVEECGRVWDDLEVAKSLYEVWEVNKDRVDPVKVREYECRQEGVLKIKDRLMELLNELQDM